MKKKSVVILAALIVTVFALAGASAYLFIVGVQKVTEAVNGSIISDNQDSIPQGGEESTLDNEIQGILVTDIIDYSNVDLVLLEVTDKEGDIEREHFRFSLRPPIKGSHKLMIPVISRAPINDLVVLGIDVDVTIDGKACTLTRGKDVIVFDVESITCFKNNVPFHFLTDMPFYNNGALYIPLETILDAFEITYRYEENKLIVELGG